MMASELVAALQALIAAHGDKEVAIDDCFNLRQIKDVDLAAEEDDCFGIWF